REPSVRGYAKRQSDTYGFDISVDVNGLEERLPSQTEVALFRIVQEALTNVAKHAGASRARVKLRQKDGSVQLTVADDGHGFDPEHVNGDRLGLFGMQERVSLIGGQFELDAKPGRGTRLAVTVPA